MIFVKKLESILLKKHFGLQELLSLKQLEIKLVRVMGMLIFGFS